MTSRLLLSGTLEPDRSAQAQGRQRHPRRLEGQRYGPGRCSDLDALCNDPDLIAQVEDLRIGEPVAVTGPFSVTGGPEIEFRITAEAVVDTKRRKKPKGQIAKEQRTEWDELDLAPADGRPTIRAVLIASRSMRSNSYVCVGPRSTATARAAVFFRPLRVSGGRAAIRAGLAIGRSIAGTLGFPDTIAASTIGCASPRRRADGPPRLSQR